MRLAPLTLALVLAAAVSAAPLRAQGGRPLRVDGRRTLSFGAVLPGVVTTVRPTDAANAGQFDISGVKYTEVEISFALPTAMQGPAGATIPLSFGPLSAGYSSSGAMADQTPADPRTPFTLTLSGNGRGFVYLGGMLVPAGQQRAGAYSATITLTVAYTGL